MFFKLFSLVVIAGILIVCLNMDTHESPILFPPKNEMKNEAEQVFAQQNEYSPIKDESESYIATSTGKICESLGILGKKEESVIPVVLTQEISSKEETNSQDSLGETGFSYPKMPQYTQIEQPSIQYGAIFISPFSK